MMRKSTALRRYFLFYPRERSIPMEHHPMREMYPLLHSSNLLCKPRKHSQEFEGRAPFDEEHPIPVMPDSRNVMSAQYRFSHHDYYLNPQLVQQNVELPQYPDYAGVRSGMLFPMSGWRKIASSWKEGKTYNRKRDSTHARATWQERNQTPRFMSAPRVCPGGPRFRYQGKLMYSPVRLTKLLWAIDAGLINRNEVITLYHLREANLLMEREIIWPGIKLLSSGVKHMPYPIHLELQSASSEAIQAVESAGGSFTATYLSPEGLIAELFPERYPVTPTADLPDRSTMERVSVNASRRGYLSQWFDEEAKYAHPEAGRRLAHYTSPPVQRDFPATFDEYEQVKHHQKWHLNQPGTGTVLPWQLFNTHDVKRRNTGTLR